MVQTRSRSRPWYTKQTTSVFEILKTILTSSDEGQMTEKNFNTSPIHNVITKFVIKHELSLKIM